MSSSNSVFVPGSDWLSPSTGAVLAAVRSAGDAAVPDALDAALRISRMSGSVGIDAADADLFDAEPVRGYAPGLPAGLPKAHVVECRNCRRPVLITRFLRHVAVCGGGKVVEGLEMVEVQLPEVEVVKERVVVEEVEEERVEGDRAAAPLVARSRSRGRVSVRRLRVALPPAAVWGADAAGVVPPTAAASRRRQTASERKLAASNAVVAAAAATEVEQSERRNGPDPMRVFLQTGAKNLPWANLAQLAMTGYQPRAPYMRNVEHNAHASASNSVVVGVPGGKAVAGLAGGGGVGGGGGGGGSGKVAEQRQSSQAAQMPTLSNALWWLKARSEREGPPSAVTMMESTVPPANAAMARVTPMFHGQTYFGPAGTFMTDGCSPENIVLPLSHTISNFLGMSQAQVAAQAGRPGGVAAAAAAAAVAAAGGQVRAPGGAQGNAQQLAHAQAQAQAQVRAQVQGRVQQNDAAKGQNRVVVGQNGALGHAQGDAQQIQMQVQAAQGHIPSPSLAHTQAMQAQAAYNQALHAGQVGVAGAVPSTPKRRRQPKGSAPSGNGGLASPGTNGLIPNPTGSASSRGQKRRASGLPGTPNTPKAAKVGPGLGGTPNSLRAAPSPGQGPAGGVGVPGGFSGVMELSAAASQKSQGTIGKGRKNSKSSGGANSSSSGAAQAAAAAAAAAAAGSGGQNNSANNNNHSSNTSSGRSTGRSAGRDRGNGNASATAAAAAAAAAAVAGASGPNNSLSMSQAQALLSAHAGRGGGAGSAQFQTPVLAAAKAAMSEARNAGATGTQPANFQQMMTNYLQQNANGMDPAKILAARQQSAAAAGGAGKNQQQSLQQQQRFRPSQEYQQLLQQQQQQRSAANLAGAAAGNNPNSLVGVQNALQNGLSANLTQAQREALIGLTQNVNGPNDPAQLLRRIAMQQNAANSQAGAAAAQSGNVTDAQLMRQMAMQHQNIGNAQSGAGSGANRQMYENFANLQGMQQNMNTANLTPHQMQQRLQRQAQARQVQAQVQAQAARAQAQQAHAMNSLNSNQRMGSGGGAGSGGNSQNAGLGLSPQMMQLQAGNVGNAGYPSGRLMSNEDVLQSIIRQSPAHRLQALNSELVRGAAGNAAALSQSPPGGAGLPPNHMRASPMGSTLSPTALQPVAPVDIPNTVAPDLSQGLLDELERALGGAPTQAAVTGSSFSNPASGGANFGEDDLGM